MKEKEYEEQMLHERNMQMRMQMKESTNYSKSAKEQEKRAEAERLKREREEHQNMLAQQREQERLKNNSIKQLIKSQENEHHEKMREMQMSKKQQARQELIDKILTENEKRIHIEHEVARMEQEELELIQKLQNTKTVQEGAYHDLEEALNGDVSSVTAGSPDKPPSAQKNRRK